MKTSPNIKKAASAKPAAKGKKAATKKKAAQPGKAAAKKPSTRTGDRANEKAAAAKTPRTRKATTPGTMHGKAAAKQNTAPSPKPPTFLDTVYKIVRQIPPGRATSYGAIAESAGIRLSARMVGWAMNAAGRAHPPVPAHRVVNSKGLLTGKHHFATPTLMQELLENEGITVQNDQIQNFSSVFWDPQQLQGKGKAKKKK